MAAYGSAYYPNQTGAVTTYAVPFEYLSADDVTVEVSGSPVAFTFISSGVVSVTPAPVGDVYIYRTTDITEAVTEFKNGAGLLASDLNSQVDQLLFAVQEASDASSVSLRIPEGERGVVSTLLPSADDRATRTLVFDADGNITVSEDSYEDNAANAAQSAVEAAQSASDAADAVALADAARVLSEAARDASGDYANDAQGYALSASGYADASAASASAAQAIVDSIGQEEVEVVVANRTLVLADNGKLFAVDASSGPVTITLPLMSTVGEPYRVTIKKTDNTVSEVSVAPSGSDTVNGSATAVTLKATGAGHKFFADIDTSPDNWVTQDFGVAVGDATPVGTEAWFTGTTPPAGWLVENGALLNRSVYPDLWSHAQASGMIVTEANWQGTTANRAKFSSGDGSTTFRLPEVTPIGLVEKRYESAEIALIAPGSNTFTTASTTMAHDLGAKPWSVRVFLVCKVAELGFSVGDEVDVSDWYSASTTYGFLTTRSTEAAITLTQTASTGWVTAVPTAGGTISGGTLTPARWRFVVRATAYVPGREAAGRLPVLKAFSVPVDTQSIDVAALANQVTALQTALAAVPLRKSFVSADQAMSNGGLLTIPHGLGTPPTLTQLYLKCVASQAGWAVGDIQLWGNNGGADLYSSTQPASPAAWADATNIYVRCRAAASLTILHKDTGAYTPADYTNWRLVVRAWA